MDNRTYTDDMTNLGYAADGADSENGHYNIDATAATATAFTLQATAQGSQANDAVCENFTLTQDGTKGVSGTGTAASCW